MKAQLIDELIKNEDGMQQEHKVTVDGEDYNMWMVAKPMNYDPEYTSKKERKELAQLVLDGKAIAVQFFEDLTDEEQVEYIRKKIKEAILKKEHEDKMKDFPDSLTPNTDKNNHGTLITK